MNRNYLFVVLSLLTWGLGEGLFLYFQPIYLQELGANPVLIGGILGAMGVAMALAQIPAGKLADRIGSRSLMWASWAIGMVATILMAAAKSLPLFAAGLILYGASGFAISPMNRYLTSVRGKFSVARSLTLASAFYNLGAVLGPITGGWIAQQYGFRAIYAISSIIFAISSSLLLTIEKNPPVHHEDLESNSSKGVFNNRLYIIFAAIVFLLIFALYLPQPLTPNFLQNQQGYDQSMIGILGTVGSLGNTLIMLFLGSLHPLAGFMAGQAMVVGFSALFLWGNAPIWFGMGYFLFGGFRLAKAMVLAFARPLVHPEETGLAFGILETVSSAAIILAPIIAGIIYDHSPRLVYETALGAMLVSLAISGFALPRIQRSTTNPVPKVIPDENA